MSRAITMLKRKSKIVCHICRLKVSLDLIDLSLAGSAFQSTTLLVQQKKTLVQRTWFQCVV